MALWCVTDELIDIVTEFFLFKIKHIANINTWMVCKIRRLIQFGPELVEKPRILLSSFLFKFCMKNTCHFWMSRCYNQISTILLWSSLLRKGQVIQLSHQTSVEHSQTWHKIIFERMHTISFWNLLENCKYKVGRKHIWLHHVTQSVTFHDKPLFCI